MLIVITPSKKHPRLECDQCGAILEYETATKKEKLETLIRLHGKENGRKDICGDCFINIFNKKS